MNKFHLGLLASIALTSFALMSPVSAKPASHPDAAPHTDASTNQSQPADQTDSDQADTDQSDDDQVAKGPVLHWINGPANVPLHGNTTFHLPEGYTMLKPPEAETFLMENGNPDDGEGAEEFVLQSRDPDSNWFATLEYVDSGHITDDNKIDADALLKQLKEDNKKQNKERKDQNLDTMTLTGWQLAPTYNTQFHRLEWATRFHNSDKTETTNLSTRILTRTGYFDVLVVSDPKSFVTDMKDFNSIINNLTPNSGNTYSDYKSGDKKAAYGLMGLVLGGTAAGLAAKGAAAGAIGKKAIALVLGLFALIATRVKKLFGKKDKQPKQ